MIFSFFAEALFIYTSPKNELMCLIDVEFPGPVEHLFLVIVWKMEMCFHSYVDSLNHVISAQFPYSPNSQPSLSLPPLLLPSLPPFPVLPLSLGAEFWEHFSMWKAELQWRGVTPLHCFGWRKEEPRAMRPIPVRSKKTGTFSHWLPSSLDSSKQSQRCRTRVVRTRNQPIGQGKVYSHCLQASGNKPKGSADPSPSITTANLEPDLALYHHERKFSLF